MNAVFENENHKYTLDGEYSVHLVNTSSPCPEHTHGYVEIVYNFSGRASHEVDGHPYLLRGGEMLFINYGCTHSLTPLSRVKYADIMLKPEFYGESLGGAQNAFSLLELKEFSDFSDTVNREQHFIRFSASERKYVESLVELTLDEQKKGGSASGNMKRSALNMLLNLIFRNMAENPEPRLQIDGELLSYIRENCREKLTAEDIAKRCFYSAEHFSRSFKKYAGKTFTEYLTECRVELAKELLRNTDKSVEHIIGECGFSGRTRFFNSFSERTGMSPLKYRKISKSGTF